MDASQTSEDRVLLNDTRGRTVLWIGSGGEIYRTTCPAEEFEVSWVPTALVEQAKPEFEAQLQQLSCEAVHVISDDGETSAYGATVREQPSD